MKEFIPLLIFILCIAAWITHIVTCIAKSLWLLLIAGALIFPVGIVHGVMIWFGFSA